MKMGEAKLGKYRFFPSVRFLIIVLSFLGLCVVALGWINISFAMICMVNATSTDPYMGQELNGSSNLPKDCQDRLQRNFSAVSQGSFSWDKATQANILAAFSWGAMLLLLPGGFLVDKYGPKMVFLAGNFVVTVVSAFTPLGARHGPWVLFGLRFLLGAGSSIQWTCALAICSRWAPYRELTMFLSLIACGYQVGPIVAMFGSGLLCSSVGWPSIFYLTAAISGFWVVLWAVFYKDDPSDAYCISKSELAFIKSRRMSKASNPPPDIGASARMKTPWRKLLTTPAVFAVVITQIAFGWLTYFIAGFLPTYMKETLFLDLKSNGFLSSIPFLTQIVGRLLSGFVSDRIRTHISPTLNVKIFNSLMTLMPALLLIMVTFLTCSQVSMAVILISASHFFLSMSTSGVQKSIVLIAGDYTGMVSSTAQTILFMATIVMNYTVGWITANGTPGEWKTTMYVASAVACTGFVVFLLFGSGEPIQWEESKSKEHAKGENYKNNSEVKF